MTQDPTSPATKQDVAMIMEHLVKTDIRMAELRQEMFEWKEETKRHFDVVAENIRHDLLHGAIADKVRQHEDRIVILERRVNRRYPPLNPAHDGRDHQHHAAPAHARHERRAAGTHLGYR